MDRSHRLKSFTLIELLVVIGVIGVLVGLLVPALMTVGARPKQLVCANNLRQWGQATALYVAVENDFLPPEGWPNPPRIPTRSSHSNAWYVVLPRVIRIPDYYQLSWRTNPEVDPPQCIWICPSNPRRSNGNNLFHYCLNGYVDGRGDADRPVTLATIESPGNLVWLFDSKNLPAVGYWNFAHTNLHKRGANFLFLDGHVGRFNCEVYWDFTRDRGRPTNAAFRWLP